MRVHLRTKHLPCCCECCAPRGPVAQQARPQRQAPEAAEALGFREHVAPDVGKKRNQGGEPQGFGQVWPRGFTKQELVLPFYQRKTGCTQQKLVLTNKRTGLTQQKPVLPNKRTGFTKAGKQVIGLPKGARYLVSG